MYSPIDSTDIRFFMYRDGYLALALKEYKFDNLDRDVQVTRDRTCRMSERLPFYADALPQIVSTLCQLSSAIKPKLRPSKDKSNFMIVGLDLMLDHQKFVWMLEANAGPVVRGADFPHIKAMIDLVIPQGYEGDPEKDIVNKLWYVMTHFFFIHSFSHFRVFEKQTGTKSCLWRMNRNAMSFPRMLQHQS